MTMAEDLARPLFERLAIPDVVMIRPRRLGDSRGYFCETFNRSVMAAATGEVDWVQDNEARSTAAGVIRGLHFQRPPRAQDKIVRCLRGAILDVAVDIRQGSPTFGRHVSVTLSEENGAQVFIPKGFAHGYATLTTDAVVAYKVSDYYSPEHEGGVQFDDPEIGIDWGLSRAEATLSERDLKLGPLAALSAQFRFGG